MIRTTLLLIILSTSYLLAQGERTMGVMSIDHEKVMDGYTLIYPDGNFNIYLINNCGEVVRQWETDKYRGGGCYLLEDGRLLVVQSDTLNQNSAIQFGGVGDYVSIYDWNGNLEWRLRVSDENERIHHDVAYDYETGNIFILAAERLSEDDALDAGRDPEKLWPEGLLSEKVMEVRPIGTDSAEVVWEWRVWDHLVQEHDDSMENYGVVAENPQLIDLNYVEEDYDEDWIHANAIEYNAELDQILFSAREFDELWVIDHSTTAEEVKGHEGGTFGKGGDLIYRWGNPIAYQAGTSDDRAFFRQHNTNWLPAGASPTGEAIMTFNNGTGRGWSSVDVIHPERGIDGQYMMNENGAYLPEAPIWSYSDNDDDPVKFYSSFISGCHMVDNRNILICSGAQGYLFEVTPEMEVVWEYILPISRGVPLFQGDTIPLDSRGRPNNRVFRAYKYATDYAPFIGQDMSPVDPIEINPDISFCTETSIEQKLDSEDLSFFVNESVLSVTNKTNSTLDVKLVDIQGNQIYEGRIIPGDNTIELNGLSPGVYFLSDLNGNTFKFMVNL